ncbi:MAG: cobalamin B12-binding domain-containing protein [Pseudomonadota bacterium]
MTFASTQAAATSTTADNSATAEYDVSGFVGTLLSSTPDDAREYIDALRASNHSLVEIYRNLLAPAAEALGQGWADDTMTFTDVTIAITKIRHLFVATAPLFPIHSIDDVASPRSILLTTVPGEQHTFGLYLAVEVFRADHWQVWSGVPHSEEDLIRIVSEHPQDVVGLSIGSSRRLPQVARTVALVREHSRKRDVIIAAGGLMTSQQPDALADLGIDLIGEDIDTVLTQANELVGRSQSTAS